MFHPLYKSDDSVSVGSEGVEEMPSPARSQTEIQESDRPASNPNKPPTF
jgi:hypothetical protein